MHRNHRLVMIHGRILKAIPAAAAAFFCTPLASAQEAGLEEIVVTAQRREQSLQEVPASVTAFTELDLEAGNVKELSDYFLQTPNVTFQEGGRSGPRSIDIAIRGISNIGGAVDAFGVYLDGFNIANVAQEGAVNPVLHDVERIEVLRGPQGTFFGRNATGGALNITTQRPAPELHGAFKTHYGSYDTWGATGIFNVPVIDDRLFARVVASYDASDGFVKNVNPAGGTSDYELSYLKFATRLLATDRITIDLSAHLMREESGLSPLLPTGVLDLDTQSITGTPIPVSDGLPFFPENKTLVNHDLPATQDNDMDIATLEMVYEGNGYTVHSITGYIDTTRDYLDDLDFTSEPLLTQEILDTADSWSEELRVQSAGDGPLTWTIGGLYAEDAFDVSHEVRAGSGMFFGLPDEFPIDIVLENTQTESWAVFGQVTWPVIEELDLTLGARYTHDDVQQGSGGIGFGAPKPDNFGETSFSDFSPRIAVSYDWSENVTSYASASKGYKAGGIQFNAAVPEQSFDEETIWNYEVGLRSFLFDRRLMLNATVFYMDWKDLQVSSFATLTDPVTGEIELITTTSNAASASSAGAELEFVARALPGLDINGTIGYLDATFDEFPNASITGVNVDLSGEEMIRAPDWTLSLNTQYTRPIRGGYDGYVRGEWSYRSETKPNIETIILSGFPNDIPSFDTVNLRMGIANDRWRVEGFVENLFEEEYFTGHSNFGFGGIRVIPHPRIWGLRFAYQFDNGEQ